MMTEEFFVPTGETREEQHNSIVQFVSDELEKQGRRATQPGSDACLYRVFDDAGNPVAACGVGQTMPHHIAKQADNLPSGLTIRLIVNADPNDETFMEDYLTFSKQLPDWYRTHMKLLKDIQDAHDETGIPFEDSIKRIRALAV